MSLGDIQGLVFHAYRRLPHARYVLLRFEDAPNKVRAWVALFVNGMPRIDCATPKEVGPVGSPDVRVNLAFTYTGLKALGLPGDALDSFPVEFAEGLGVPWPAPDRPDHRSRILGDVGESSPDQWAWGFQRGERRVDALLLAFAREESVLDRRVAGWIEEAQLLGAIARDTPLAPGGATTLRAALPEDPETPNREAFGFVDGISQPLLKCSSPGLRGLKVPAQPRSQVIEDGEILLGRRDGTGLPSSSPSVAAALDPDQTLPQMPGDPNRRDLGFDGTYLVFRQLEQNVDAFRAACEQMAARLHVSEEYASALIVGRWPNGSPLVMSPIAPDPGLKEPPAANNFSYGGDPYGDRCPMGAHIRRANPRDALGDDPAESVAVTSRHRLLRRGRPYVGERERGLHFIALNASIARQFEFVQQNWMNSPTFAGLVHQDDPLVGSHESCPAARTSMTLPPPPQNRVPRSVPDLARFVAVKGGAYCFLPSLTALRYLSNVPAVRQPAVTPIPKVPLTTAADTLRFIALCRFPILGALLLLLVPLLVRTPAGMILASNFDLDGPFSMLVVALAASLTAAGIQIAYRIVHLYAKPRFDVTPPPLPMSRRIVALFQALSLPAVGVAWWRSATDAALASGPRWWTLLTFAAFAAAGYAVSFALLYMAAAVRAASVRRKFAYDAVLLPIRRAPSRGKEPDSLVARVQKRLARTVEARGAKLSETAAAGYLDRETGAILPGHLTALAFVAMLVLLYVAGWFVLWPWRGVQLQLPPLAYALFLLLAMVLGTSALAFWLDRLRVPLLTLIVGWLAFAAWLGGTDHQFHALPNGELPAPITASEIVDLTPADKPIVIVAAAGGGIRQAAWTARVLAGLKERYGDRFVDNVRLVSAISGGGAGSLPFLNWYSNKDSTVPDSPPSVKGEIWWGLTYADVPRALFPYVPEWLLSRARDRGWALEQAWQRSLHFGETQPPTIAGWGQDVRSRVRPAFAFNATVVETGQRAVIATYELPTHVPHVRPDSNVRCGPADQSLPLDAWAVGAGDDLSVFTAARLSAAFPYVSPVARADSNERCKFHYADGGYWDNSGMTTALEWLRAAPNASARDVLVIQIAPAPPGGSTAPADRSFAWQLAAPADALLSVRTNAQAAHTAIELDALRKTWHGRFAVATFVDTGADTSLGWHLSRREAGEMKRQWDEKAANHCDTDLLAIDELLDAGHLPSGGSR